MITELEAHYFDGRTARRQRVSVRVRTGGLEITTGSGTTVFWPLEEIRHGDVDTTTDEVHLERGGETPEILVISASRLYRELRRDAPGRAAAYDPERRRIGFRKVFFCALGAVAVICVLYFWGIPGLSTVAASFVPVSWEERLGEEVAQHLAPAKERCNDPGRARVLEEIVRTLTARLPQQPYKFRLIVVNDGAVNALAAPGGYIIIFRGLLDQTQSAEELAGVLAHEMQHVLLRHSTRALLQQATTGVLLAAVTGDTGGATSFGGQAAQALALLSYSRKSEEEADNNAVTMLIDAGVNPAGLISFFEKLDAISRKKPRIPVYLSTHPDLDKRLHRLRPLTARSGQPAALLPSYDWTNIHGICAGQPLYPVNKDVRSGH